MDSNPPPDKDALNQQRHSPSFNGLNGLNSGSASSTSGLQYRSLALNPSGNNVEAGNQGAPLGVAPLYKAFDPRGVGAPPPMINSMQPKSTGAVYRSLVMQHQPQAMPQQHQFGGVTAKPPPQLQKQQQAHVPAFQKFSVGKWMVIQY
jgi:hypothetical protein